MPLRDLRRGRMKRVVLQLLRVLQVLRRKWAPELPATDGGDPGAPGYYFRCLLTSLVISNIETCFLPPKTSFNFSSALMLRLFLVSCSLFFLM